MIEFRAGAARRCDRALRSPGGSLSAPPGAVHAGSAPVVAPAALFLSFRIRLERAEDRRSFLLFFLDIFCFFLCPFFSRGSIRRRNVEGCSRTRLVPTNASCIWRKRSFFFRVRPSAVFKSFRNSAVLTFLFRFS